MRTTLAPGFVEYALADQHRLQAVAYTLTGNRSDAEDLVQQTLLRLARSWARIDERGPHGYAVTFICRLARRRSTLRLLNRVPHLPTGPDLIGSADTRLMVRATIRQLPPRQRAVVALRYLCDMSEAQTADALGARSAP